MEKEIVNGKSKLIMVTNPNVFEDERAIDTCGII